MCLQRVKNWLAVLLRQNMCCLETQADNPPQWHNMGTILCASASVWDLGVHAHARYVTVSTALLLITENDALHRALPNTTSTFQLGHRNQCIMNDLVRIDMILPARPHTYKHTCTHAHTYLA